MPGVKYPRTPQYKPPIVLVIRCLYDEGPQGQSEALTTVIGYSRRIAEIQALSKTLGDARWLETCIQPVLAVITFYGFIGLGVPLTRAPWASGNTTLASYTGCLLYTSDAADE